MGGQPLVVFLDNFMTKLEKNHRFTTKETKDV